MSHTQDEEGNVFFHGGKQIQDVYNETMLVSKKQSEQTKDGRKHKAPTLKELMEMDDSELSKKQRKKKRRYIQYMEEQKELERELEREDNGESSSSSSSNSTSALSLLPDSIRQRKKQKLRQQKGKEKQKQRKSRKNVDRERDYENIADKLIIDNDIFVNQPIEECNYCVYNGLRYIRPYFYRFKTYCKRRWLGRTLIEVCDKEFKAYPLEYYKQVIADGRMSVNGERVTEEYLLTDNDFIVHSVNPLYITTNIHTCDSDINFIG
eukprot:TRINITY_DN32835_c0_g1_i1.p1 TRINITY_DN32835_c0_g1~~TRINITY_DN32835_c0_g1_i1.p1  ORF type:complete len:265 (-),score=75.76 TRINITY_DN32835_c0_g1_i1:6-800(-)